MVRLNKPPIAAPGVLSRACSRAFCSRRYRQRFRCARRRDQPAFGFRDRAIVSAVRGVRGMRGLVGAATAPRQTHIGGLTDRRSMAGPAPTILHFTGDCSAGPVHCRAGYLAAESPATGSIGNALLGDCLMIARISLLVRYTREAIPRSASVDLNQTTIENAPNASSSTVTTF